MELKVVTTLGITKSYCYLLGNSEVCVIITIVIFWRNCYKTNWYELLQGLLELVEKLSPADRDPNGFSDYQNLWERGLLGRRGSTLIRVSHYVHKPSEFMAMRQIMNTEEDEDLYLFKSTLSYIKKRDRTRTYIFRTQTITSFQTLFDTGNKVSTTCHLDLKLMLIHTAGQIPHQIHKVNGEWGRT